MSVETYHVGKGVTQEILRNSDYLIKQGVPFDAQTWKKVALYNSQTSPNLTITSPYHKAWSTLDKLNELKRLWEEGCAQFTQKKGTELSDKDKQTVMEVVLVKLNVSLPLVRTNYTFQHASQGLAGHA